tara:strand:- start:1124 stop:1270 length:147 start_codon:yes stop_codon:yes gene_type:complete
MIGTDQLADILKQIRALGDEVTRLNRDSDESQKRIVELELAISKLLKK